MKPSSDEVIKRLRNDPTYKRALALAQDVTERRRVIGITEGVVAQLCNALVPLAGAIQQDPDAIARFQRELNATGVVVNERDGSVVSGSIG